MAQDWNPNAPVLTGQEWLPTSRLSADIRISTAAAALGFTSTAAETIDRINFYADGFTEPNYANAMIEIYQAGNEIPGAITTDTYRPNEDTAVTNVEDQAGGVVNIFNSINEATLDTSDYIVNNSQPAAAHYTCKLNSAAFAAGRRVTDVRIVVVAEQILGTSTWNVELRKDGAGFLTCFKQAMTAGFGIQTRTISLGDINPFTGLPWTQTEIASFDDNASAGRLSLTWRLNGMSTIYDGPYLYQLYIEVDSCAENREAVGRGEIHGTGWFSFAMQNPSSGADNWAKGNATDYTALIRRVDGVGTPGTTQGGPLNPATGGFSWGYFEASSEPSEGPLPVAGMVSYEPTIDSSTGAVTAMGDAGQRGYTLILRDTGPATSVDGQPYAEQIPAQVSTSLLANQKITPTADAAAQQARFLVGILAAFPPTDDLVVTVREHAGGAQVGGVGTFTLADLLVLNPEAATLGSTSADYVIATVDLEAIAGLTSGTQYRLEFSSASDDANPWLILGGDGVVTSYGIPSYGGTTDDADVNGDGYDDDRDLFAHLVDPGPTVLDLQASVVQFPNSAFRDGCGVTEIDVAELLWAWPAGISADAFVEIQRKDRDTWETIAYVTDQTWTEFYDFEVRRGSDNYPNASYRFRVVDLVPSNWTPTNCTGVVAMSDSGAGLAGPIGDFANTDTPWIPFGGWERTGSAFRVVGGVGTERFALFDTGQSEPTFRATVGTTRETGWGVVILFVDSDNHVRAYLNTATNEWTLEEVVGGVVNVMGGPTAGATTTNTSARLTVSGGMVTLAIAGVDLIGPVAYDPSLVSSLAGLFADDAVTSASRWAAATTDVAESCVQIAAYGCELIFGSNNFDEGGAYAWDDVWLGSHSERDWTLLDASQVQFFRLYGRDRQVAFQPTERDGDTFTRTLSVNSGSEPTQPGREVFDSMENWFRNSAFPYLAVLDSYGRRWLAVVQLSSVLDREPGWLYLATVTITEIATAPTPIVI